MIAPDSDRTRERALTPCKSSKHLAKRKRSQSLNNTVRAKGTSERALTPCPKERSQFSNNKVQAKGTADRARLGPKPRAPLGGPAGALPTTRGKGIRSSLTSSATGTARMGRSLQQDEEPSRSRPPRGARTAPEASPRCRSAAGHRNRRRAGSGAASACRLMRAEVCAAAPRRARQNSPTSPAPSAPRRLGDGQLSVVPRAGAAGLWYRGAAVWGEVGHASRNAGDMRPVQTQKLCTPEPELHWQD